MISSKDYVFLQYIESAIEDSLQSPNEYLDEIEDKYGSSEVDFLKNMSHTNKIKYFIEIINNSIKMKKDS